ncbi:MAG TPA: N-methyl-L-tryptophan oxidase [Casimicrobiaceae bacterium]|nr:N-methyl-L-tryptophan oxidase [Casimicrobiaceae bacterium]
MNRFEAIVLGLGAMGSAAVHHLARRGRRVLGIDRFSPPHAYGSSHGGTRITRLAIGEGEQYTPLALRSHELWREMERATGATLLTLTRGLVISSHAKTSYTHVENFFQNTLAAAQRYGIAHEELDAATIRKRFPKFKVADDERGYLERDAGFLRPEECVRAQLVLAERHGAEIRRGETVQGFDATDAGVEIATDRGSFQADNLILTAGPWLPGLVGEKLARYFRVYRQVMFWFDLDQGASAFAQDNFPVFIWELQGRKQGIYGFPAVDGPRGGMKVATESFESATTPDRVSREVSEEEKRSMFDDYVAPRILGVSPRCLKAAACLYTVTPDFGFVIDAHPDSGRVLIASACSGHGFKHSPAVGEALAQRLIDGASTVDLSAFSLARFGTA